MMIFGTQSNERKKNECVGVRVIVAVHYQMKTMREKTREKNIPHKNTDCVWFALIFQTKRKILARF